ncbi:HalOD1 output domain-containing protein [Natronobiforma cellulositropha]|uniref:HalOD1 output domain-containing protein n=1 Tax=Natronobiforma cellulositropha TaxID=1679076 RepID=UPI0021D60B16|nr:HalOD1 output domain-containing protein [Natronobiforma cellulositropha]
MSRQSTGGCAFGNGGQRHRVRYGREQGEPPSVAVATALADYHGEDVRATSTHLYDYVDPEALDALFADRYDGTTRADGQIRFQVHGVTVVVRAESVVVYATE